MRRVVGIDRKIKREWADAVLDRLVQATDEADLRSFLDKHLKDELPGKESRAKTTGIVLRIWSGIPPERAALRARAVAMLPRIPGQERIWLHWGMAALAYPFFRDTAEVVGRLLALQDDFTTAQVQGRMLSTWGDRATSREAAQKLLGTLVDWEVLRPTKAKAHFLPGQKMTASTPDLQLWLLEALLAASAADEIEAQQLLRRPEGFPFTISVGVADLRRYDGFNIHRQGLDMDMVALRKVKPEPPKPAKKRREGRAGVQKSVGPGLFDGAGEEDGSVNGQPRTLADVPFATPVAECAKLLREGRHHACVALAQAVVESTVLLVWRKKVRRRKNQTADFSKALEALHGTSLIGGGSKSGIERLGEDRLTVPHLRPSVEPEKRRLEEVARTSVKLVNDLAGEFFGYTEREGLLVPDHPEYWSASEEGSLVLAGGEHHRRPA